MSLENKSRDMTPFDMSERPVKQSVLLTPLMWAACYFLTAVKGLGKVEKIGFGDVKPPYLVIAVHQGASDYYIAPRAMFPHRAVYISDMEGFAAFGKGLYRSLGCIGKRRYVSDVYVVKNIRYALSELKQSVVIYPESRHSDIGITSSLPDNLGHLVKHFGVPTAVLTGHGSYLANPFWDEEHTRRTKLAASLELVFTADEIGIMTEEEIQNELEKRLQYDEYEYQYDSRIRISHPKRAEGLHLPLYRCISCGAENMTSSGIRLICKACGNEWELTEYGRLVSHADNKEYHIPDIYRAERAAAEKEAENGYHREFNVRIEALPNEKGFVKLGNGKLIHSEKGYVLYSDNDSDVDMPDSFPVRIKPENLASVQTEYNYRGRGKCIVISTKNCCYYCYSDDEDFNVTKQEFIQEYFYRKNRGKYHGKFRQRLGRNNEG